MVIAEIAAEDPRVSDAGENEQDIPAGKPEQDKATGPEMEPETGVTVSWAVAFCPATALRAEGDALS